MADLLGRSGRPISGFSLFFRPSTGVHKFVPKFRPQILLLSAEIWAKTSKSERMKGKQTWNAFVTRLSTGNHFALVLLSICLVVASLWIPTTVRDRNGMKSIELGYPIRFVIQDNSRFDPPSFPWQYRLVSPWESPTEPKLLAFLGSVLIVLALLELAATMLRRTKENLFQKQGGRTTTF